MHNRSTKHENVHFVTSVLAAVHSKATRVGQLGLDMFAFVP